VAEELNHGNAQHGPTDQEKTEVESEIPEKEPPILSLRRKLAAAIFMITVFTLYVGLISAPLLVSTFTTLVDGEKLLPHQNASESPEPVLSPNETSPPSPNPEEMTEPNKMQIPPRHTAPPHRNHTLVNQSYSYGDTVLRVLSVGDVLGKREIIIWLEFHNAGEQNIRIATGNLLVRVGGDPHRACYYTSWSEQLGTEECNDYVRLIFRHPLLELAPNWSAAGWAIFELPKYEYDSVRNLTIEYFPQYPPGRIVGNFTISRDRQPEDIPFLTIISPREGQRLEGFGSLVFRVFDTDQPVKTINWSIELDGRNVTSGHGKHPNFCPLVFEKDLQSLAVKEGHHHLVVYASDGRVSESASVDFVMEPRRIAQLQSKWSFNTSAQFEGKTFGAGHQGCQTVWDIDGDGTNEIIFGTRRGNSRRLWCIDAKAKLEWIYPPIDQEGLPGDPTSKVSLIDTDNDGTYELCFAGRGGRLHVLNPDGTVKWTWDNPDTGTAMHGAPQAYDVDGDGYVEFFLNTNSGFIDRVDHKGNHVWRSFRCGDDNQGQPTIADIDQDGRYEILWASNDHHVYCISADDATLKWKYDSGANLNCVQVIVADINNDGRYEALTWARAPTSALICLNAHGQELWEFPFPRRLVMGEEQGAAIRLCQAMGDVDGDGSMDMVLMTSEAELCVDIGGQKPVEKWRRNFTRDSETGVLPPGAVNNQWTGYPLIADIDGDGNQEILWLAPYPIVTDGATGQIEACYTNPHIALNRRAENGGWWGDLDGDGESEWLAELNGNSHPETQLYCLTTNGKFPAQSPWPEYYHTAYPAEYQAKQDWLTLKSAYSNSLWFPIKQAT